jgi:uncharacterized protein YggE
MATVLQDAFRLVAFAAAVAACTVGAQAQEKLPSLVTVTGEGRVNVAPDLAIVRAGLTTRAKGAREASEANAKAMGPVMTALKEAGVVEKDIQTAQLSLQPVREPGNPERIAGFQASNQLTIKVRDMNKISDVIDRMVSSGANDISGVSFIVSDPSKLLDGAREQAIADARHKAENYARAANVRLGAAVSITEGGGYIPGPVMRMSAVPASTPISVGEETEQVRVTVSFELLK